jgi:hypothetical protein
MTLHIGLGFELDTYGMVLESMYLMQISCKYSESAVVKQNSEWPEISLGGILDCGPVNFKDKRGRTKHGTQHLYRIPVSESVYTIWKMQNKRVISRAGALLTEAEIIKKCIFNFNQYLQQDVLLANRSFDHEPLTTRSAAPCVAT